MSTQHEDKQFWVNIDNGLEEYEELVKDAHFYHRVVKDGKVSFPEVPAKIFAAAPMLLEALEEIRNDAGCPIEGSTEFREQQYQNLLAKLMAKADKAIALAEGKE